MNSLSSSGVGLNSPTVVNIFPSELSVLLTIFKGRLPNQEMGKGNLGKRYVLKSSVCAFWVNKVEV